MHIARHKLNNYLFFSQKELGKKECQSRQLQQRRLFSKWSTRRRSPIKSTMMSSMTSSASLEYNHPHLFRCPLLLFKHWIPWKPMGLNSYFFSILSRQVWILKTDGTMFLVNWLILTIALLASKGFLSAQSDFDTSTYF